MRPEAGKLPNWQIRNGGYKTKPAVTVVVTLTMNVDMKSILNYPGLTQNLLPRLRPRRGLQVNRRISGCFIAPVTLL
ncbi:hypothetical protein J6590_077878 [Homalodisca vitripennis]|nr:hypothetical protein J6590_077878 [Homalodisca vitripennis]